MDAKGLDSGQKPTWCPGCGNFALVSAVRQAIEGLGLQPEKVLIVSGIGCGSKLPHFVKAYGFEGLHGRVLPVAMGAKLANQELTVIGVAGDGDAYGIGGNHFIHTCRKNPDITYIVQNNSVYGLTKGQYSPTSPKGFVSPTSPRGSIEQAVNPLAWAITTGATYVARAWFMDAVQMKGLIMDGISHHGFALIDVLMPCLTYNRAYGIQWYKERVYKLYGHDAANKAEAMEKAAEKDRLPTGLFYTEKREAYGDEIPRINGPLYKQDVSDIDITPAFRKLD